MQTLANDQPLARLEPHQQDESSYLGGRHGQVVAALRRGIRDREFLVFLSGLAGVGKTTVLNAALAPLAVEPVRLIRLSHPDAPTWTQNELAQNILSHSPEPVTGRATASAIMKLTARRNIETQVVLAVDDAHTLTDDAMELLVLIASPTRGGRIPPQLIMAGRGAFWNRRWRDELQLITNLAECVTLQPLTRADARAYVAFRLKHDADALDERVEPRAMTVLLRHSGGLPGQIDRILAAVAAGDAGRSSRVLTAAMVDQAIASFDPASMARPVRPVPASIPMAPAVVSDSPASPPVADGASLFGAATEPGPGPVGASDNSRGAAALDPAPPALNRGVRSAWLADGALSMPDADAQAPIGAPDIEPSGIEPRDIGPSEIEPSGIEPRPAAQTEPLVKPAPAVEDRSDINAAEAMLPEPLSPSPPAACPRAYGADRRDPDAPTVSPPGPQAKPAATGRGWVPRVAAVAIIVLVPGGIASLLPGTAERFTSALGWGPSRQSKFLAPESAPQASAPVARTDGPPVSEPAAITGSPPTAAASAQSAAPSDGQPGLTRTNPSEPSTVPSFAKSAAAMDAAIPPAASAAEPPAASAAEPHASRGADDVTLAPSSKVADLGLAGRPPVSAASAPPATTAVPGGQALALAALAPDPAATPAQTTSGRPVSPVTDPVSTGRQSAPGSPTSQPSPPAPVVGPSVVGPSVGPAAGPAGGPSVGPAAGPAGGPSVGLSAGSAGGPLVDPEVGPSVGASGGTSVPTVVATEPAPAKPSPAGRAPIVVATLPPRDDPASGTRPIPPTPPAAAAEAPSGPGPSPETVSAWLRRGDELLRQGDVLSARLFFERAAMAGSGEAAISAGKTYDPNFLATMDAPGLQADAARALGWYRAASAALGDADSAALVKSLTPPTGPESRPPTGPPSGP